MALIETLVAASILAVAIALFLSVVTGARFNVAQAQDRTTALAIAADVLRQAQARWPNAVWSGARSGHAWTLRCEPRAIMQSPRLTLRRCTAEVSARGVRVRLSSAWAARSAPR